jgi:hypothetical protein
MLNRGSVSLQSAVGAGRSVRLVWQGRCSAILEDGIFNKEELKKSVIETPASARDRLDEPDTVDRLKSSKKTEHEKHFRA